MAKVYEYRTVPERKEKYVNKVLCDLCGKGTDHCSEDVYERREVDIRAKDGEFYPEGASWEEYGVDMCFTCFKEKLWPWLQENSLYKLGVEEKDTY